MKTVNPNDDFCSCGHASIAHAVACMSNGCSCAGWNRLGWSKSAPEMNNELCVCGHDKASHYIRELDGYDECIANRNLCPCERFEGVVVPRPAPGSGPEGFMRGVVVSKDETDCAYAPHDPIQDLNDYLKVERDLNEPRAKTDRAADALSGELHGQHDAHSGDRACVSDESRRLIE